MATTVGERAKEEAEAQKARSVDRDLNLEVQGIGQALSINTGKPLLIDRMVRRRRLRQKEEWAEAHTEKDGNLSFELKGEPTHHCSQSKLETAEAQLNACLTREKVCFTRVESIELVGVQCNRDMMFDDEAGAEYEQRLEALMRQIPAYFDWLEEAPDTLAQGPPADVPCEYLGMFKSPCKDFRISREWEWVRALWREPDDP